MKTAQSDTEQTKTPEKMALDLMINKNIWLTKIRAIYTVFILLFFSISGFILEIIKIRFYTFVLIMLLIIVGNGLFLLYIKKTALSSLETPSSLGLLASLQLDFDLVILSMLVFFSGGFNSPVITLFIFYIMLSTFLIHHKKAFRNTITAIILITLTVFVKEGNILSSKELTNVFTYNTILFFAYLISAYLSKNIREKDLVLQKLLERTKELSITDGLTDLYNQSHFFKLLHWEFEKSTRYDNTFSVVLFDLDNFKNYNDNNGHIKGSNALKTIGQITKRIFRKSDILAKYGGDEFVVLLPKTDKIGSFLAADRLRETVASAQFPGGENQPLGKVTISVGIANYPEHGISEEEILDKADRAMYIAKKKGRNNTVIYQAKDDKNIIATSIT